MAKEENATITHGYVTLGPTDDADNVTEYINALEWALAEKNIKNIAIAGPLGAGKSSIINTYLKKHPCEKYINISLAAFKQENGKIIGKHDYGFEKQIEEGVLKQLFYKEHYSKLPQSRYTKLHKVSFWPSLFMVSLMALMIYFFVFLFYTGKIVELGKTYADITSNQFGWCRCGQIISIVVLVLGIIIGVTLLFMWIEGKWRSVEINIANKAIIKANEKGEALSLNKNMDEILYFFDVTDYTLVIFEDLDRFKTPEIYTKLREINKIINDYDSINRKVVFIYALSDDIFLSADRTKFFDYIIPVIPYISATNSGEYLNKRLDVLKKANLSFNISKDYVMNVAPFISDMRVLSNICNEFIVYRRTIKDAKELGKLQDERMFSLMIFKNLYPKEFAKMQESGGIVKQAYDDRNEFIEEISLDLKKEIKKAEEDKAKSDSEKAICVEDLKLAFIMKIVEEKGVFLRIKGSKGSFDRSEIMQDDFALSEIGEGSATLYYGIHDAYYNRENTHSISSIEKIKCSDGMTYYEACDRAIARGKNKRKQIAQNLIDKQTELYKLRSKTMKTLIDEYGADKVLSENVRKNKLLVFMLRHGYIDGTYQLYINHFLPGSITVDELNFIMNVRNHDGEDKREFNIVHPENVVSRLFDYELEQQKECLNFSLADFFYGDAKISNKKTGFTRQLTKDDADSRKFIKDYYIRAKNKAEYIKDVAQHKPLFWFDICSDVSLGYQDKVTYLLDIFNYLDVIDIVLQDTAADEKDPIYSIRTFIVESDGLVDLLQETGIDKVIEVLSQINVKLKDINLDSLDTKMVGYIYERELFEISLNMLQKFADFKAGKNVHNFNESIYSHLLALGDLSVIDYLEKNIYEFISEVILKTETNTKEKADTILKCIKLIDYDEELSVQLIRKMDIVMEDLQEWIDSVADKKKDIRGIIDAFLNENKLKASIENLDTYKSRYSFSTELCEFVDNNIDLLLADKNIDDIHIKEFLKNNIQEKTIEKILQSYELDLKSERLSSYKDVVVKNMISLKYFNYTRSRYEEILSSYPELLPLFAKCYWQEFESEVSTISFDASTIDRFLKADIDDKKKVIFLKKASPSKLTGAMCTFVFNTEVEIPKEYVVATWDKLSVDDRPALLVKFFDLFDIKEIENMINQMPNEYLALIQKDTWHNARLANNSTNKMLLSKLDNAGYISHGSVKEEKKSVFGKESNNLVLRVKARKSDM